MGLDHEQGRGLPAPNVPPFRLRRLQGGHQPLRKIPGRSLERARHRRPHRRPLHQVGLDHVLGARLVPGGRYAQPAGVPGHASPSIDHPHLPHVALGVGGEEGGEGLGGRLARPHEVEAESSVRRVDEGLGGDGADARFRPGHDRAHREPVALYGHAKLARRGVTGHDGIGGHRTDGWSGKGEQDERCHGALRAGSPSPARTLGACARARRAPCRGPPRARPTPAPPRNRSGGPRGRCRRRRRDRPLPA